MNVWNGWNAISENIYLPVIVLGEYRYGVKSSRLRVARESWLDELESAAIVLAMTSETSRVYADIRHELRLAGQPIPENDLWIARLSIRKRRRIIGHRR